MSLEQRECERYQRDHQRSSTQREGVSDKTRSCNAGQRTTNHQWWLLVGKERLLHDAFCRNDVGDARLEVPLMDSLRRVGPGLRRRGDGGLQDGIADVPAAYWIFLRKREEVHVWSKRCACRMHLDTPDLLAFHGTRHFEQDVHADAAFERRVEISGQIRGEDDDSVVPLQFLEQHADNRIRL